MPLRINKDFLDECAKCGGYTPWNHLKYQLKVSGVLVAEYTVCVDCASMWNAEIQNHFLEWISKKDEVVQDGP